MNLNKGLRQCGINQHSQPNWPLQRKKKRVTALKEMPGARKEQVYELTILGVVCFPSLSVVHVHPCDGAEGEGAAGARGAAPV